MSILQNLHDAVFEEDHPKTHPAVPIASVPVATPTQTTPVPVQDVSVVVDADATHDDSYQRLFDKSDFSKNPTFAVLQKYLDPLKDIAIDEKTKFSMALKQAQALDGLQVDQILGAFDSAQQSLNVVSSAFADRLKDKAAELDNKKAAAQQALEDAFSAKQRLEAAQHKFETALQTRTTEIAQARAKYAALIS